MGIGQGVKVGVLGFAKIHYEPEVICEDCGCRWVTNEASKHIKINGWTGKIIKEQK